ncbi:putative gcn5-related n-acetyltransferase [Triangularia setosa]|uniref:Gcn5-related n-acetyltransferase n=1 Tax=Triangularia setosa TaxID=2587417 RepID=A0AAN6W0S1_9PEZI|nr:putative gcn5-related n-acetyltransferase [Podospora setosa]
MQATASWRPMSSNDIPAVMLLADKIHPDLPESASIFAERIKHFTDGCLVLAGEEICGYIMSHPIRKRCPPALDSLLAEIPQDADQYYIHDVAILPTLQGRGLSADGIRRVLTIAQSYHTTCLVSVYGTFGFWSRFGFEAKMGDPEISSKIQGYGADALYLERQNTAEQVLR